ncbi:hypothetical protein MKW94_029231, partial [Papaver nudicaule]|nr:hypothetical protein [Papaver nudicaule]
EMIEFLEFCGDPWELYVVELFLKNARFLQRLTVPTSYRSNLLRGSKLQFTTKLLMLPRASTSCVIKFS